MKLRKFDLKDKKTLLAVAAVCTAFVLLFGGIITAVALISRRKEPPHEEAAAAVEHMRGVWIASVSNIDFPSAPDLTKEQLESELDSIVDTADAAGLNAVFFQVRPSADALFASDIFPVSRYMSTGGTLTLDALEYLCAAAHKKGIAVHAWINPLRVAAGGDIDSLPDNSPAKKNPAWVVKYADGKLYFDCGREEVRKLICDGIKEIVENYDVDGVVFDDYFYPYPKYIQASDGTSALAEFDDGDTFAEYGRDFDDIGDWRRDNVNKLVRGAYETVKSADEHCAFGVAPFGIWKNGYGDESGSETRGSQSYYDIYCDTVAWIEGGYVDYVAPQLYWRESESAAPYDALCDWWSSTVEEKGDGIKLIICHAAYRYEDDWENPAGTMLSQLRYASEKNVYSGSVFYGYEEIRDNLHGIRDELLEFYGAKNSEESTN